MNKLIAMTAAGLLLLLGACNTIEGMGQDVERGGEAISDTAEDAS